MANRNSSVGELLKFAPEGERAVSRPGQSDAFVAQTHVETLLERDLLSAILADEFDLVLLTGNPGDGKSAFLGPFVSSEMATSAGRPITCLHDATEPSDSEDRAASALVSLVDFLGAVGNPDPSQGTQGKCLVVGINLGLLQRAFLMDDSPLRHLGPAIRKALEVGNVTWQGIRIVVVDLNRRGVMSLPVGTPGLLGRLIDRLTSPGLWEEQGCATCTDASWCPFFKNAQLLRDPLVRSRFDLVWLVQQLEAERHSTLRDVLAALAYVVVGHEEMYRESDQTESRLEHPCAFVEREAATGDYSALLRRLIYNSTFSDRDIYEGQGALIGINSYSEGRTLGLAPRLVEDHFLSLDPATKLNSPWADSIESEVQQNWRVILEPLADQAERENSRLEHAWLSTLCSQLSSCETELERHEASTARYAEELAKHQWLHLLAIRYVKRRSFFHDRMVEMGELTPYRHLPAYLAVLSFAAGLGAGDDTEYYRMLDVHIPRGITAAEGITSPPAQGALLRWSGAQSRVGAVLPLDLAAARLTAEPAEVRFLEHFPRYLRYWVSETGDGPSLVINLRTFEGLSQLSDGYVEPYAGLSRSQQVRAFRDALRAGRPHSLVLMDFDDPEVSVQVRVQSGQPIRFA